MRTLRLLLLLALLPAALAAARAEPSADTADSVREVRVGFYLSEGYHAVDARGWKSGYGYDFLQMVRRYSNLSFTYLGIGKSREECLRMLRRGEVDLVTGIRRKAERERWLDYSYPIGDNAVCLNVRASDRRYSDGRYRGFDGMTVGMVEGDGDLDRLRHFAARHGFGFDTRLYKDAGQLPSALARGEVDAICSGYLPDTRGQRTLCSMEGEHFYAVVRKGDTPLLDEVNNAIMRMDKMERDWTLRLNKSNYQGAAGGAAPFTGSEQDFIRRHSGGRGRLVVATDKNWRPYSWRERGVYRGIIVDYVEALMRTAGIDIEWFDCEGRHYGDEVMRHPEVDVYVMSNDGLQQAESKGFVASPVFMEPHVAMLSRSDRMRLRRLAVSRTTPALTRRVESDSVTVMVCESTAEAVEAVREGRADGAYLYNYVAQLYVNEDPEGQLRVAYLLPASIPLRMIVRESADRALISILSQCINRFDPAERYTLAANYLMPKRREVSYLEFVRQHSAGLLALALLLVAVFLVWNRRKDAVIRRHNEAAREAAERANEAKTAFLFTMSHDVRTPLNAIVGFTELLRRHQGDAARRADYIGKIIGASRVLLSIINNVLEMARIEKGQLRLEETPMDVDGFDSTLFSMFDEMMTAKSIKFTRRVSVRHGRIYCDVSKMREVLLNLLSNAYKYTPSGGSVTLVTEELEGGGADRVLIRTRVSDTGVGMSEEYQKHLFEEFSRERTTTETKVEGTGLGMPIVKRLLEVMGGDIAVESAPGRGTTFTVTTPHRVAPDDVSRAPRPAVAEGIAAAGRWRVLLAEDNDLNGEIAMEMLGEAGVAADRAEDGRQCLEMLTAAPAGTYDAVLMDVQMPVMGGYEATRAIRRLGDPRLASIPVVAMTANAFEEDRREALEAGMDAHVAKPFDVGALLGVLADVIGRRGRA